MAVTPSDLQAFHDFALAKVAADGAGSLVELVHCWEEESRSPADREQDLAAVNAALDDMQNGDVGRPAEMISQELRTELSQRG